jgi:Rho GDP-dissociation inhibitor
MDGRSLETFITTERTSLQGDHADAEDESLQRYKASLGLGGAGLSISDPNDKRQCIILSLTMDSPGRDPVTIDLSTAGAEKSLKDKPFKIKEGAKFTMSAKFKVQHQILSGLHYVQVVKRKGIRVSKDQEMLVSCQPILNATLLDPHAELKPGLVRAKHSDHSDLRKALYVGILVYV